MNSLTWTDVRDTLRKWRETNDRQSEDIIYLWTSVLELNLNKLGNEKYLVLEQVCVAALDCNSIDIAKNCIKLLSNEFPKSHRVQKYVAMCLEAQGRYDAALQRYDKLIKEDETNSAARKRKIAILKAQGKIPEAVKELTDYLKIFMIDTEAWQELCDLYISEHDYGKAAFCVEELILHHPQNHLYHQRYADIKYTQGGYENLELAKAYYCQTLKLCPNNMRALYGLYLAATNIANSQKPTAQKKKDATKLAEWSFAEIQNRYLKVKDYKIEDRLAALQLA